MSPTGRKNANKYQHDSMSADESTTPKHYSIKRYSKKLSLRH